MVHFIVFPYDFFWKLEIRNWVFTQNLGELAKKLDIDKN